MGGRNPPCGMPVLNWCCVDVESCKLFVFFNAVCNELNDCLRCVGVYEFMYIHQMPCPWQVLQ